MSTSIGHGLSSPPPGTAPLTIFFNGTVKIFHLPLDKAEAVMKLAEGPALLESTNHRDMLPIARRKSLQQFLARRKERVMATIPYGKNEETMGQEKEVFPLETSNV